MTSAFAGPGGHLRCTGCVLGRNGEKLDKMSSVANKIKIWDKNVKSWEPILSEYYHFLKNVFWFQNAFDTF